MALVTAEVVPTDLGQAQFAQLVRGFAELGFQTGPTGPGSVSIAGAQEIFERTFQGTNFAGPLPAELPVATLPSTLSPLVKRIVFTLGYVPFTP
jgi:hypothetical protein